MSDFICLRIQILNWFQFDSIVQINYSFKCGCKYTTAKSSWGCGCSLKCLFFSKCSFGCLFLCGCKFEYQYFIKIETRIVKSLIFADVLQGKCEFEYLFLCSDFYLNVCFYTDVISIVLFILMLIRMSIYMRMWN